MPWATAPKRWTALLARTLMMPMRAAQRNFSLTADGVCGCNTWKKLTSAVVGIGHTKTVID